MLLNIIEENNIIKEVENSKNISAEEKYLLEFPKRDSEKLKYEVGKIAELLVGNQESNRYTNYLRKKVSQNKIIKQIQNSKETEINILSYDNNKMKAEITYKDLVKEYSLVLDMNTVSQGRLFVRDFNIKKGDKNNG